MPTAFRNRSGGSEAGTQPEPVRRHAGRPHQKRQTVLFRVLSADLAEKRYRVARLFDGHPLPPIPNGDRSTPRRSRNNWARLSVQQSSRQHQLHDQSRQRRRPYQHHRWPAMNPRINPIAVKFLRARERGRNLFHSSSGTAIRFPETPIATRLTTKNIRAC